MTHIEQAISAAIARGYEPALERYPEIADIPALQLALAMTAEVFLDPGFWQALGRARGWTSDADFKHWQKSVAEWNALYWKSYWHRFIDHLAEGGDAESYFAALGGKPA